MIFLVFQLYALSISEYFRLYMKITTSKSSRLLGKSLWHYECLKNWQKREAIIIETFRDTIILKLV